VGLSVFSLKYQGKCDGLDWGNKELKKDIAPSGQSLILNCASF
jgi:hypothetical protein